MRDSARLPRTTEPPPPIIESSSGNSCTRSKWRPKREQNETALSSNIRRSGGRRFEASASGRGGCARGPAPTVHGISGHSGDGDRDVGWQEKTSGRRNNKKVKWFRCKKSGLSTRVCPRNDNNEHGEFVFLVSSRSGVSTSTWFLDSGPSCHMTCEIGDFSDFRELKSAVTVVVADGQRLEVRTRYQDGLSPCTDLAQRPRLVPARSCSAHGWGGGGDVNPTCRQVVRLEGACRDEPTRGADSSTCEQSGGDANANHGVSLEAVNCGAAEPVRGGCGQGKMSGSGFAHRSGGEVEISAPFELVHSGVMGSMLLMSKSGGQYVA
ncbi:hypothetical protein PybrP1_003077 [[Pythium] brassicae (nom. inval.)]|nr:hypothetical protein PybrP1_003077 [[Pythium] brassicae (nom. inval.)]